MPKIKFYSWTYTAVLITQNHQIVFKNEFIVFAFGSQNNVPPGASGGSDSKNLPAMQETQIRSLSLEDPLEKEMAAHSSVLAWRIPWTEEPGGL